MSYLKEQTNTTIEVNPSRILDTKIPRDYKEIKSSPAYHKKMKLPFYWTSVVPNHYKENVIIGDLHRVKNLSSNLEQEVSIIKEKCIKAGCPFCFINSVINGFNKKKKIC